MVGDGQAGQGHGPLRGRSGSFKGSACATEGRDLCDVVLSRCMSSHELCHRLCGSEENEMLKRKVATLDVRETSLSLHAPPPQLPHHSCLRISLWLNHLRLWTFASFGSGATASPANHSHSGRSVTEQWWRGWRWWWCRIASTNRG